MRRFHYPYGPKMRIYKRKPVRYRFNGSKRHNKFGAHKILADGQKFDSKTEYQYYELLKLQGRHFKCHQRFEIVPHSHWNMKHNYTPDFCIYNNKGDLIEVDDTKGYRGNMSKSYDSLRMDLFSKRYHIPVTIVRKKRGKFVKKQRRTFKS